MQDRSKLSAGIIFSLTLSLLLSAAMKATTAYEQQKAQIFVQLGHTDQVRSVAFSPDGRYLASVGQEAGVKLWEVASGREITTIAGKASGYFSVVFSADGKYLLAGGGEGVLELFDVAAAKSIRSFTGHSIIVTSVALSADAKYALSGGWDNTMRLWNVEAGGEIRGFSNATRVESVAISPDAKRALLAGGGTTDEMVEATSGKSIGAFTRHAVGAFSAAFPSDGKSAATATDKLISLWTVADGKEIRELAGHSQVISGLAFSRDGRLLVSGSWDKSIRLWNVADGSDVKTLRGPSAQIIAVAISADARLVAAGDFDQTIKLWEVTTGALTKTLRGHLGGVGSVAFSPEGKYLLSGSEDGTMKLWDVAGGKEIRTFAGHSRAVTSVAFSPDGKYALSGSRDNTTRLWDVATGEELAAMIGFIDGEWIIITPAGFYSASPAGGRYVNVRVGNRVYGIDQYRSGFYKPQLVEAAMHVGNQPPATVPVPTTANENRAASIATAIEPPIVVIKSPEEGQKLSSTDAQIAIVIEDREQPIQSVKVYINGRPVTGTEKRGISVVAAAPSPPTLDASGIRIPEGRKSLDLKIPAVLEHGQNLVEVVASNGHAEGRAAARVSAPEATARTAAPMLPTLWILSIGVDRYDDKQIPSLAYPADDADAIVDVFRTQEGRLFGKVNTLVINDKSSTKPTYANILDSLNYLSRAGQYDVALLFIAGHGFNDEGGDFYFLPSDAALAEDGTLKRSKAVSWRDIKATLDLPAKVLIFVDACHSAGVSGRQTRGVDSERLVKELQEANAVVFTSSRGRELSQESASWKHGAFT